MTVCCTRPTDMKFAIFDLDHTLLPVDSGDGWSRWLVREAGLNAEQLDAQIQAYADAYHQGTFDVDAFMGFQMGLLAQCRRSDLEVWRHAFVEQKIRPYVPEVAVKLVKDRQQAGFVPVLASGTHQFVTRAIAPLFGIDHVVGACPEENEAGEFTGRVVGSHSYQDGKRILVEAFLRQQCECLGDGTLELEAYSDSINDVPLLRFAAQHGRAFAVNPDSQLRSEALKQGWQIMDIFKKVRAQDV